MKKIFTLFTALLMGALSMSAQDELIFVDASGNVIPDGSVITMNEATFDEDWEEWYVVLNGISVKNTTSSDVSAIMDARITAIPSGDFACCLGTNCRSKSDVGTMTISGVTIKAGETLPITNTEWKPMEYGTCTVELQLGSGLEADGPTITVNFVYADPSGIEDVVSKTPNLKATYFTVDGKRLAAPQKGLNIVRYSNGTVKKIIL